MSQTKPLTTVKGAFIALLLVIGGVAGRAFGHLDASYRATSNPSICDSADRLPHPDCSPFAYADPPLARGEESNRVLDHSRLGDRFDEENFMTPGGVYWPHEDYYIGYPIITPTLSDSHSFFRQLASSVADSKLTPEREEMIRREKQKDPEAKITHTVTIKQNGIENHIPIYRFLNPKPFRNYRRATDAMRTFVGLIESMEISQVEKRLKEIHAQLRADIKSGETRGYRKKEIKISRKAEHTNEERSYQPPRASEVPSKMRRYAAQLQEGFRQMRHCSEFDPVRFAATAHMELVNIFPFKEANGRFARLIMQAILKAAGYPVPIIRNYDEYIGVIEGDRREPGTFATFLKREIRKTQGDMTRGCLDRVTCPGWGAPLEQS